VSYLPVTPKFGRRAAVDTVAVTPPHGIRWETQRMSWRAIGGPHRASVRAWIGINHLADMLDYLRNGVKLYDAQGVLCWWGYVHEVRVRWGVSEVGISLDQMFNKVKVAYKTLAPGEDATEDAETDWAENAISTGEYGDKELILSAGRLVLSEAAAEQLRDTRLAQIAFPQAVADYEGRAAEPMVEMLLRGWWETLGWTHYSQIAGRYSYTDTSGGAVQAIGQSTSTLTVSWDDADGGEDFALAAVAGTFDRYSEGIRLIVTNSGAGSDLNDGTYNVDTIRSDGTKMSFLEDVDDDAAATAEFTPDGDRAAQSFLTGDAWTVVTIAVRARTVGNPGDSLRVSLYSDSAGSPNGSLAAGTIAASELDDVMRWRVVTMTAGYTLVAATTYWVHVERTGSSDADDAYHVELNTKAGDGGTFKLWNGASWTTRTDVDMPFDVIGGYASSTLIKNIIETSAFVTEVTVIDAANSITVLQQVEDQTVKAVAEGLLDAGTGNDRRLLAVMDEHRAVQLKEEPPVTDTTTLYKRGRDGTIRDRYGAKVEPQRAGEIVGNWLENEDIRAIVAPGSDIADAGRAFIEEAEWTLSGDAVRLTARGSQNVWS
jgi:hypothetical protein